MNRNDMYNYLIFLAVIGWLAIYRFFLQNIIDETTAGTISIVLIIGPILFLEVGIKLLVAGTPYLRAIVRSPSGTYTMRLFLEEYPEITGDHYNSAVCSLKWPSSSPDFGEFDTIKLIYHGSWGDVFKFSPGRAVWKGYEIGHPQTENAVLFTLLQNATIIDHTDIIPTFFVKDASGHYTREMKLIPASKPQAKEKPQKVKPKTEKPDEKQEETPIEKEGGVESEAQ